MDEPAIGVLIGTPLDAASSGATVSGAMLPAYLSTLLGVWKSVSILRPPFRKDCDHGIVIATDLPGRGLMRSAWSAAATLSGKPLRIGLWLPDDGVLPDASWGVETRLCGLKEIWTLNKADREMLQMVVDIPVLSIQPLIAGRVGASPIFSTPGPIRLLLLASGSDDVALAVSAYRQAFGSDQFCSATVMTDDVDSVLDYCRDQGVPASNGASNGASVDIVLVCSRKFVAEQIKWMMDGRLVVVAGHGMALDFMKGNKNCLAYRSGDVRCVASGLIWAVHHPYAASALASAGRGDCLRHFSNNSLALRLEAVVARSRWSR